MLRVLVVGLLAAVAVAGCGKDSAAPQVAPNAPAGRVVDVSGKVGATRGGVARRLAIGTDVYADDVIETPSDGAVVIELFHNNARWAVDGSLKSRVDESAAWGLAKQDTPTKLVEHATSAAGRNAERLGADTMSSTEKDQHATVAPTIETPVVPSPGNGAPPIKTPVETGKLKVGGDNKNKIPTARPPAKPPEQKPAAIDQLDPGGDSKSDPKTDPKPKQTGSSRGGVTVGSIVDKKRGELVQCVEAEPVVIDVRVVNGAPTVTFGTAPSAKVRDCVTRVIKGLVFSVDGQLTLRLVK